MEFLVRNMKVSDDINAPVGFFAGDLPNGNCKIQCEKCKFIFENTDSLEIESCFCPNCKIELFYRSWWEW